MPWSPLGKYLPAASSAGTFAESSARMAPSLPSFSVSFSSHLLSDGQLRVGGQDRTEGGERIRRRSVSISHYQGPVEQDRQARFAYHGEGAVGAKVSGEFGLPVENRIALTLMQKEELSSPGRVAEALGK